jgi:hypothetical protein
MLSSHEPFVVLTMSKIRCSWNNILSCSAPINLPCTGNWSQFLCSLVTNSTFHQVKKNVISLLLDSLLRLLFILIPVFNQTFGQNPIILIFQPLSMPTCYVVKHTFEIWCQGGVMFLLTDSLAAEQLLDKTKEQHEHCEGALGIQQQFFNLSRLLFRLILQHILLGFFKLHFSTLE